MSDMSDMSDSLISSNRDSLRLAQIRHVDLIKWRVVGTTQRFAMLRMLRMLRAARWSILRSNNSNIEVISSHIKSYHVGIVMFLIFIFHITFDPFDLTDHIPAIPAYQAILSYIKVYENI